MTSEVSSGADKDGGAQAVVEVDVMDVGAVAMAVGKEAGLGEDRRVISAAHSCGARYREGNVAVEAGQCVGFLYHVVSCGADEAI